MDVVVATDRCAARKYGYGGTHHYGSCHSFVGLAGGFLLPEGGDKGYPQGDGQDAEQVGRLFAERSSAEQSLPLSSPYCDLCPHSLCLPRRAGDVGHHHEALLGVYYDCGSAAP